MGHDRLTKLFLWMEDHDNSELPEGERRYALEEAVQTFNEENGTEYKPANMVHQYTSWQRERQWD